MWDSWLVSTLNKYQSTNYITLPHFGDLWRLLAAHVTAMTLELISCQGVCDCVSNFVFCVNGTNLDKPLTHMFTKMLITNFYVLGPWA
jgi:hypothetical protein